MQPLFINSNTEFLTRINDAAKGAALVASNFSQASGLVNDTNLAISAVYLNPNDPSSSALRFLGELLRKRPATPVFILDDEGDFSAKNFSCLADKFNIRGSFRGPKSFAELLQPVLVEVPAELKALDKRSNLQSTHSGYIAVPLVDFIYSKHYPANVFVEDATKALRFFAMEGSEVDLEYLSYLARSTSWLYIEESSIESRVSSYRLVEQSYLDPSYLSPSWRTAEVLYRAKVYLNELKAGGVTENLVNSTYNVLGDLFQLTSQVAQDLDVRKLVDQAKRSDRAIAAVTLSVLLCKKLKFERASIVETLGFASLMQDVSLYVSPYGNISETKVEEMTPEARTYYVNHPVMSSDMLGKIKDIPELTLQIVRQQHERTDRTGFPNRVGGSQLQPLAEILSLINAYLDRRQGDDTFYHHYSTRVVQPFQQIIMALESTRAS